jgi:hypothetical protein
VNVAIVRGTSAGLAPKRSYALDVTGKLRLADLDLDGHPELAFAEQSDVGVCRGSATGPHDCKKLPTSEHGGRQTIAVGDVTGSARREVIVGTPEVDDARVGAVELYRYTHAGLRYAFRVDESTRDVPGKREAFDEFGTSVAVGQVDLDRKADLVIGSPGEDHEGGSVTLVRGATHGLGRHGNRRIEMDTPGIPGERRTGARFGAGVALLDHDRDGRVDLDAGAPEWKKDRNGVVIDVPGGWANFRPRVSRMFDMESFGFSDRPYEQDYLGGVFGQ